MKTEQGKSWIESQLSAPSHDGGCRFCRRDQPEAVREIQWSRNGFQVSSLEICRDCRSDLRQHLSDEEEG